MSESVLRQAITGAQRRVAVCEARYQGLVRALVSDQSVLWYARDSALHREFEAGFDAGLALKGQGLSGR
jgi:hypothetical protein